jgi:hypothetical protein
LAVQDEPEDLDALRLDAARYRWLRERAVRINGSQIWWSGDYLDTRVDTGLSHVHEPLSAEPPTPTPLPTSPAPTRTAGKKKPPQQAGAALQHLQHHQRLSLTADRRDDHE